MALNGLTCIDVPLRSYSLSPPSVQCSVAGCVLSVGRDGLLSPGETYRGTSSVWSSLDEWWQQWNWHGGSIPLLLSQAAW